MNALVLDVEAEEHDVAFLHDILPALAAQLTRLLCSLLAARSHKLLVGKGLCANEPLLEVRVDHSGSLWEEMEEGEEIRHAATSRYTNFSTCGAVMPLIMVHALVSVGPEVKYVCNPSVS